MKKLTLLFLLCLIISFMNKVSSQVISKEELTFLTSEWKGERFPDGRPKISDDLITRARKLSLEDAWQILNNEGYVNQFEGKWKMVRNDVPIIGRAVTATFIPSRPDLEKNIKDRGWKNGFVGNTNSWPISVLQKGDVYVADCFGKIKEGTMMGDMLATSIYSKTGNGVIFDAAARDLTGITAIKGFNAYVRDFHPSFLLNVVLSGLNTPTRIGDAIVMPGDLVITDNEGVLFIPSHMADYVITTAEFMASRANFSRAMLRDGIYSSGQMDSQWTDAIKDHFIKWLQETPGEMKLTRAQLDALMTKRTW
jgi:regulator of RNase E activity RraA